MATPAQPDNPNFSTGIFVVNAPDGGLTVAVPCESDKSVPMPRWDYEAAICDHAR